MCFYYFHKVLQVTRKCVAKRNIEMSKFRSKLKRHSKGAKWARGQSATSNPENKKHRNAARSRFFQPNLNTGTVRIHVICYIT